jgi:hypothetical protein
MRAVQEVLVDGRELELELRVEVRDDLCITLHGPASVTGKAAIVSGIVKPTNWRSINSCV